MRVTGLYCSKCRASDLVAVWPGKQSEHAPGDLLFPLLPGLPAKAWCERCWLERFGPGKVTAEQQ